MAYTNCKYVLPALSLCCGSVKRNSMERASSMSLRASMNVGYLPVHTWTLMWEIHKQITVGRFLIAWFNDCVLGKTGQIVNPIIAMVNPVPYYSIRARSCLRINYIISFSSTPFYNLCGRVVIIHYLLCNIMAFWGCGFLEPPNN